MNPRSVGLKLLDYTEKMYKVNNQSTQDITHLDDILKHFMPYNQKQLGWNKPVNLFFSSDKENANKILGRTAHYNPEDFSITVYIDGRHPKDVLRSLSHELVHHDQNCRGEFDNDLVSTEAGYAQNNPHLRRMELEAYKKGNIIFRDFEDLIKTGKLNIKLSGEPKMSLQEWKNKELNMLLMEKWGIKEKRYANNPELDKDGDGRPKWVPGEDDNDPNDGDEAKKKENKEDLDEAFPGVPPRSKTSGLRLEPRAGHEPLDVAAKRAGSRSGKDGGIDMKILDNEIEQARKSMDQYRQPSFNQRGDQGYWMAWGDYSGLMNLKQRAMASKIKSVRGTPGEELKQRFGTNESEELEEDQAIFAPNHYCVHHGGVQHEGQIRMAEAIGHNFDEEQNRVTWYNMKLADGTILEQVNADDIFVTNASLAEMHHKHRVEDDKKAKKDPSRHVKKTFAAPKKRKDEEKRVNVQEAKDLARRIFEKLQKESV